MIELAASILSADFAHLAGQVRAAEQGGASVIHFDVMDGHFVPNITIGPPVLKSLRAFTKLPIDCHLMIEDPDQYIEDFCRFRGQLDNRFIRKLAVILTEPCILLRVTGVRRVL